MVLSAILFPFIVLKAISEPEIVPSSILLVVIELFAIFDSLTDPSSIDDPLIDPAGAIIFPVNVASKLIVGALIIGEFSVGVCSLPFIVIPAICAAIVAA